MKKIPLTQGLHALVDDEDLERVSRYRWRAVKPYRIFYAKRDIQQDGQRTAEYLHRLVMEARPDQAIDHINSDGLDNRRSNLRFATQSQNNMNSRKSKKVKTSQFKGVHWYKRDRKWVAKIMKNEKTIYLGCFTSEQKAALAYDQAAQELFGEFARPNFPQQRIESRFGVEISE